jgi:hypothetical protein
MHLDDERLQRLLDAELPPDAERSAREHAASCASCARRLDEARREEAEVRFRLRALDHPAPALDAGAIERAAPLEAPPEPRRPAGLRWVAGLVAAAGLVGAAWAMPGSPLPAWARAVASLIVGPPAPTEVREPGGPAGISVAPGERLIIVFEARQAAGEARIDWTDGPEVVVTAPAGAATFAYETDQLAIGNRGSSASFDVRIPREAPRVEIFVGGPRVFLKEGPRVVVDPGAGLSPPYRVRLRGR